MITSKALAQYQAPRELLANKTILISGASDGIGRVAANTFAEYGATVILTGRTMAKLETVYDEIENAGHPQPAIFPMNFESAVEQDYTQLYDVLQAEFQHLDGLLHNAALLGPRTPLAHYPIDTWQTLMQVNVTAPFMLTRALMPLMRNARSASIVFTGSSVGLRGRAYWGAYGVSKAACENLMQTLADELDGTSVRVNSLNPGATRTAMRALAYPAENPDTITAPEAIMNRYLFLLGEDSQGINGQQFAAQLI